MKAPFRRMERDDEQRHRKWRALATGLLVAAAGTAVALGPLVPSQPAAVLAVVALTSMLAGALVGWRVRERKGSMGGMVAQLFAFPLGCCLVGFPQSAGLNWIVFLFIAVPCAAVGGNAGQRAALRHSPLLVWPLGSLAFVVFVLAIVSKQGVRQCAARFQERQLDRLRSEIANRFLTRAEAWQWTVRWQKGVWQGDYFLLTSNDDQWRTTVVCGDDASSHVVTLWASLRGRAPVSPRDSEAAARRRLLALGLQSRILVKPQFFERYWEFGRDDIARAFISTRKGDAAVMFDSRDTGRQLPRSVIAASSSHR